MIGVNAGRPWTGPLRGECSVCHRWFTLRWSKTEADVVVVAPHRERTIGRRTMPGAKCAGADEPPALGTSEDARDVRGPSVEHSHTGNCWDGRRGGDDACLDHDEPRGECSRCAPCRACAS